jgi:hypothetical protein
VKLPILKISIALQLLIFGVTNPLFANPSGTEKETEKDFFIENLFSPSNSNNSFFHQDSIHRLNFRYPDKKRGLNPWIAPTLLMSTGTALHFATTTKNNAREFMQENLAYHGRVDDYLQYVPGVAVYAFNALGIKGKNNFGNSTALMVKSFLLNGIITDRLKYWINEPRPNGGVRSFPSGHTSKAFMFAHFVHKEFGELSPWFTLPTNTNGTTNT